MEIKLSDLSQERVRKISVLMDIPEEQVVRLSLWIIEHLSKQYFKNHHVLEVSNYSIKEAIQQIKLETK